MRDLVRARPLASIIIGLTLLVFYRFGFNRDVSRPTFPSIKDFKIEFSQKVDLLTVSGIVNNNHSVEKFPGFSTIRRIRFKRIGLPEGMFKLPAELEWLDFSDCLNMKNDFEIAIPPTVATLSINRCSKWINSISWQEIPRFQTIDISNSEFIGNAEHWVVKCDLLRSLRISQGEIDADFLLAIKQLDIVNLTFDAIILSDKQFEILANDDSLLTLTVLLDREDQIEGITNLKSNSELTCLQVNFRPEMSYLSKELENCFASSHVYLIQQETHYDSEVNLPR